MRPRNLLEASQPAQVVEAVVEALFMVGVVRLCTLHRTPAQDPVCSPLSPPPHTLQCLSFFKLAFVWFRGMNLEVYAQYSTS